MTSQSETSDHSNGGFFLFLDRHVFPVRVTSLHTDLPACAFPDSLQVEIKSSRPFPALLVLYRKDVINTNAPAYVIKRHENGDIYLAAIDSGRKVFHQCIVCMD